MIKNKKIAVVLPAYNAANTLERTYREIPSELVDEIILCDDGSTDNTLAVASKLGIKNIVTHELNKGYGANQKSCYLKALELKTDIVVLLHPDYQYSPQVIPSMIDLVANGLYKVVLGSRILGKGALKGGMPLHKYFGNRFLTLIQNLVMQTKLSEFHTGYRAYSADLLRKIDFMRNSDDFIFDNQILAQIIYKRYEIGEVSCPTHYFPDASSIGFRSGLKYFLGVLGVTFQYIVTKAGLFKFRLFDF
jgi:glycosyltransferase involved in cell wall biosynthesis